MTRVLFSAKIQHRPPTQSPSLPPSFSFLLSAFCRAFRHELSVHPIVVWAVLCSRRTGPNGSWTGPSCRGEQREVNDNGTLGQLVRVKLGTSGWGWWWNSSGSCIPTAHQAISGAARGGTKQELIRGAVKTKKVNFVKFSYGEESTRRSETRGSTAVRKWKQTPTLGC